MIPTLLLFASLVAAPQEQATPMTTYQMVFLDKGPNYDAVSKSADAQKMQQLEPLILGFLVRGSNTSQTAAAAAEIQKGHLAYMSTLHEQGKLLVAGPFMDDAPARGIVIYRVATVEDAKALAAEDPAVKAGRLVLEPHPWMTFKGILK
jgi:uncharacterized protein YciI